MSLLWPGVSETPSLAWHVVIYSWREYIPVIKCIGYKQNHGADPDWLTPYSRSSRGSSVDGARASSSRTRGVRRVRFARVRCVLSEVEICG